MTCHSCKIETVKAGRGRNNAQRWKCQQCGKRFPEVRETPLGADVRLPRETVCRILHCLVEGNSVRGTARLCDVEKRTVMKHSETGGRELRTSIDRDNSQREGAGLPRTRRGLDVRGLSSKTVDSGPRNEGCTVMRIRSFVSNGPLSW
jgi:transposase-like protein